MLHLRICVMIFMVLIGTILSEEHAKLYHYHDISRAHTSWIGRFGFNYFNELRKQFCHSFCKPADIDYMSYIANLMCAAKCPELYLPHSTSTQSTESTTTKIPMTTTAPNTISPQNPQQNQSSTPSSTTMLSSSTTITTTSSQNPQQNQSSIPSSMVPSNTSVNTTP